MQGNTKQLITEQLLKILESRSLEQVTVKYLVEACHVSRQTFYYHFQDIIDVLEWGARMAVEQGLAERLRTQNPRDAIRVFVGQITGKEAVIRRLLASERRAECERILMEGVRTYLQALFRRRWPSPNLPLSDVNAFLDFHSYGLVGLILKQCDLGVTDKELLVDQICRMLSGEMKQQFSAL